MKLLIFIFLMTLSALSFAQDGKKCSWDSDCQEGYFCSAKQCVMGSWPSGGCSWDSDCLEGYYCSAKQCVMGSWPSGGCSWDSDCLTNYICVAKQCVYKN